MPRNTETHRRRMAERRTCQLARTSGFDPVPSARFAAAFTEALEKFSATVPDLAIAAALAMHQIAAGLPALPFARRHREPRPSKSDDAGYRRGGQWPALA